MPPITWPADLEKASPADFSSSDQRICPVKSNNASATLTGNGVSIQTASPTAAPAKAHQSYLIHTPEGYAWIDRCPKQRASSGTHLEAIVSALNRIFYPKRQHHQGPSLPSAQSIHRLTVFCKLSVYRYGPVVVRHQTFILMLLPGGAFPDLSGHRRSLPWLLPGLTPPIEELSPLPPDGDPEPDARGLAPVMKSAPV